MKKIVLSFFLFLSAAVGCVGASAAEISPSTGQQYSPVPYILGAVAIVLIIAIVILSIIGKKKKK